MTKALVTGGAGFIGSNVARLLAEDGDDVVVLDNLTTGYRENLAALKQVRLAEADVRDASALDQATNGGEAITIYDDGEQTRDFVNVRDVARANIRAAETRGLSGAFNVASGEAITVNGLV